MEIPSDITAGCRSFHLKVKFSLVSIVSGPIFGLGHLSFRFVFEQGSTRKFDGRFARTTNKKTTPISPNIAIFRFRRPTSGLKEGTQAQGERSDSKEQESKQNTKKIGSMLSLFVLHPWVLVELGL